MKIAIITCHTPYNYGAVLQCYALVEYLKSQGHTPMVIDYQTPPIKKSFIYKLIRNVVRCLDFRKCKKEFSSFLRTYIPLTKPFSNVQQLMKETPQVDVYLAGSDQIWNPKLENGKDDAFFLRFIDDKRKISYAASVGDNFLTVQDFDNLQKKLSSFSAVSVRESSTARLFCLHGIHAKSVLDPVFLLDKAHWLSFQQKKHECKEPYVLVYSFYRQRSLYQYARKLADSIQGSVYVISTLLSDQRFDHDRFFWVPKPEEFVSLFANAHSVVTNSYHGLVFALMFEKPMHIFDSITGMDRINDLIECLHLREHIVKQDANMLCTETVDWGMVNSILADRKHQSCVFLEEAIVGDGNAGS